MNPLIVRQCDGTLLDHVVLGTPDMEKGLDYVESLAGIRPLVNDTPAGTGRSFVSARLSLSGGLNGSLSGRQFLQVIGPNPGFEGEPDGVGTYAAALPGPRLVSWAMGVRDLAAYRRDAAEAGYPFNCKEYLQDEGYEYEIGDMGAGLTPHIPSIIEWRSRADGRELAATVGCRIAEFTVHHPEPQAVQRVYDSLGIDMLVRRAEEPRLRLVIETPRDDVILS